MMQQLTITRSRVWSALATPPAIPASGPRLKTNLNTDLLKLIAITAMLIDHIGGAFFPDVGFFRWIGRLAFPHLLLLFDGGLALYPDVRKYLLRLGVFALVSQPFYVLALPPGGGILPPVHQLEHLLHAVLSLLALYGVKGGSGGCSPWRSSPSAGGTLTTPAPAFS